MKCVIKEMNGTDKPFAIYGASFFRNETKTLKLMQEVHMDVRKKGIFFKEFLETSDSVIKVRVKTVETILVNYMRLNHTGKSTKASKRVLMLDRKV